MKYTAVIFDLDGTLLDTLEDLCNSVNFALAASGLPQHDKEKVKSFVGNGVEKLIERALPNGAAADLFSKVLADFKAHYAAHAADRTKPYPQVLDMLAALKKQGIKIGVVSNKYDAAVKELCPHYFGNLIDIAVGESPKIHRKPAPDMLLHAIEYFGLSKKDVLFVGDSDVDAQTAQNAAVDFIGVTWGFRTPADMRPFGAKLFIDTPIDIQTYI